MGSSGLIYAAIVAGWAAVLVPRWVRRNEEIEQAREADQARGVRVLGPSAEITRRQGGASSQARHEPLPVPAAEPPAEWDQPADDRDDGQAARRRRRVLIVLVLGLAAVIVTAVIGKLPLWSVAIPALLLGGFLQLARRATAVETSRARAPRRRPTSAAQVSPPPRANDREEPQPAQPMDPDAWEPVPVPLPTYLLKDKAPDPAIRTIDLTQPGAWTSSRLEPAGPAMPRPVRVPPLVEEDVDDPAEHRAAVGD